MTLVAAGPAGGQIDWKGNFSLIPFTSEGTLKVTDGKMKSFWPYVRDALAGARRRRDQPQHRLQTESVQRNRAAAEQRRRHCARSPSRRRTDVRWRLERLDVSETSLDLAKQQVVVGKIRSNKLETWAALEADGQLDWQKLFASQPQTCRQGAAEPASGRRRLAERTGSAEQALARCCSRTCNCATTGASGRPFGQPPWRWM
jgi:hypothetical protein